MKDKQYIDVKENNIAGIDRYAVHVDMPDVDGKYREIAKLMADISEVTGYGMMTKGTTLYIDKDDIGKDVLDEILKEANDRIKDKVEKENIMDKLNHPHLKISSVNNEYEIRLQDIPETSNIETQEKEGEEPNITSLDDFFNNQQEEVHMGGEVQEAERDDKDASDDYDDIDM